MKVVLSAVVALLFLVDVGVLKAECPLVSKKACNIDCTLQEKSECKKVNENCGVSTEVSAKKAKTCGKKQTAECKKTQNTCSKKTSSCTKNTSGSNNTTNNTCTKTANTCNSGSTFKTGVPIQSQIKGTTFSVPASFSPTGFIGDTNDLKVTADQSNDNLFSIEYKPTGTSGSAGLFWQNGADTATGFNLKGANSLTFAAKGTGSIDEFSVGGIALKTGAGIVDSSKTALNNIALTGDWKTYTIDLSGKDLTNIIGAFGFTAGKAGNPAGFTMDIKDIQFNFSEK